MNTTSVAASRDTSRRSTLVVRGIGADEFWEVLAGSPYANFQQTPEWGRARAEEWRGELLGFYDDDQILGVTAVRYRSLPGSRWSFAYIPFGPIIDWESRDVARLLGALRSHLRSAGAFAVRMMPPLTERSWSGATVRAALQDESVTRLAEMVPDAEDATGRRAAELLGRTGWRRVEQVTVEASQALYNVWLPLDGRSESDLQKGMNSTWRRNIRLAARNGVAVEEGSSADLPAVKRMYDETAERLGFATHPLSYFESMFEAFGVGFPGSFHLHIARHEGQPIAAMGTVRTGRRAQALFIVNSSDKRQLKASNAVYDVAVRTALAEGAAFYDFGGVDDGLDEGAPESGLLRFKASMGGVTHEYLGSWDLPLVIPLYWAFSKLLPVYSQFRQKVGGEA